VLSVASERTGPGTVIARRYRVDHIVGQGGMATVWAATDIESGLRVALKFMRPEDAREPTSRERFFREGRTVMGLVHPNIVRVHAVAETEVGTPFLVMDLLAGESLRARLVRDRRLSIPETCHLTAQMASALAAAHAAGITHRDLKPENVIVSSGHARVVDFGVAKVSSIARDAARAAGATEEATLMSLTQTGSLVGTPLYMAPEQVYGDRDVDPRADVWALGIIVYECVTGSRPTEAEGLGQIIKRITRGPLPSLSQVAPGLPPGFGQFVMAMLSLEREHRPSMPEVAQAFGRQHFAVMKPAAFAATLAEPPHRPSTAPMRAFATLDTGDSGSFVGSSTGPVGTLTGVPSSTGAPASTNFRPPAKQRSALPWMLLVGLTSLGALGAGGVVFAPRIRGLLTPAATAPTATASGTAMASVPPQPTAPPTQATSGLGAGEDPRAYEQLEVARGFLNKRDGKGCLKALDDYDRMSTKAHSTDPSHWASMQRAQCLMLAGDCSGGRALYEKAVTAQNSAGLSPQGIALAGDSLVPTFCEGNVLTPRDQLLRSQGHLRLVAAGLKTMDAATCRKNYDAIVRLSSTVKPLYPNDQILTARQEVKRDGPACLAQAHDCHGAYKLYMSENTLPGPGNVELTTTIFDGSFATCKGQR
jgi:eukaryotic-like serine/threonine-protein kinase